MSISSDRQLLEEIGKKKLKIEKVYRDGVQYSSSIFIPEDKVCDQSLQILVEPEEISEKAKKADIGFQEALSYALEEKRLPQHLHNLLEQQKSEAAAVLQEYDEIISQLKHDLDAEDKEYRMKIEGQSIQHELLQKRVEEVISEMNKVGEKEVHATRNLIVNHSKHVASELWQKNKNFLDESSCDKPFDSYLWKPPTEMLTLQELEKYFLTDQEEIFNLRRNLPSKVCQLRNQLEIEKLNYYLKRERIEQGIFYLEESCKETVHQLLIVKRKFNTVRNKRDRIYKKLIAVHREIEKEEKIQMKEQLRIQINSSLKKTVKNLSFVKHFEFRLLKASREKIFHKV